VYYEATMSVRPSALTTALTLVCLFFNKRVILYNISFGRRLDAAKN